MPFFSSLPAFPLSASLDLSDQIRCDRLSAASRGGGTEQAPCQTLPKRERHMNDSTGIQSERGFRHVDMHGRVSDRCEGGGGTGRKMQKGFTNRTQGGSIFHIRCTLPGRDPVREYSCRAQRSTTLCTPREWGLSAAAGTFRLYRSFRQAFSHILGFPPIEADICDHAPRDRNDEGRTSKLSGFRPPNLASRHRRSTRARGSASTGCRWSWR